MPLQSTSGAASYDAFGGGVAAVPKYIEEYFSTFLYSGTGSAQTITNNIDLSTKGGLVWLKARNDTRNNWLYDTVRGKEYGLRSDLNFVENYSTNSITAFNNNGFSIGDSGNINTSGNNLVSWSWAKAPKFFDVVTYTGNSVAGREIAHNLGSVPGCMIVKSTSDAQDWAVYHRSLGNTKRLVLNGTDAEITSTVWNNTTPTSTVFTVSDNGRVNSNGSTYVAYLFAHDAGGFGLTGTDNVISCGGFTKSGSSDVTVNLGFEPQWILMKSSSNDQAWFIFDTMRGMSWSAGANYLNPNTSSAETPSGPTFLISATGFTMQGMIADASYIYIAIRRGPMKVPTSGTSVFQPIAYTGNGTGQSITTGITGDLTYIKYRTDGGAGNFFFDRLRNPKAYLDSSSTAAEVTGTQHITAFNQLGFSVGNNGNVNDSGGTFISQTFRRAPSFFDEVCFTTTDGTYSGNHNLGVVPELLIFKSRDGAANWQVVSSYLTSASYFLRLNSTIAEYNNTNTNYTATSTTLTIPNAGFISFSATMVAYLFATCAGVSKCTSFTGNGTSQTINCGFTSGARFVMIKATSTTGNWTVFDSARGISAGGDPALYLNSTAAEVTGVDAIDTDSTGFIVNQEGTFNLNSSGVQYLVLAIA